MRVRAEHWELLMELCETNPELITNKFNGPNGKAHGHALWQNVAQKLNSLGFGEKSTEEWRKALIDWKSKTKAKASKIKQDLQKTGGGPANYFPLSQLENRLIVAMGIKAIDGDEVSEMGFGEVTIIPKSTEDNIEIPEHDYCKKKTTYFSDLPSTSQDITYGNVSEENSTHTVTKESELKGTTGLKRKCSDTRKLNRRVRPKDSERLSQKLTDTNEESLHLLRNIAGNVESMANSLKIISSVMQNYFSNTK